MLPWSIARSIFLVRSQIRRARALFSILIEPVAAPCPHLGVCHQPPFHRVHVQGRNPDRAPFADPKECGTRRFKGYRRQITVALTTSVVSSAVVRGQEQESAPRTGGWKRGQCEGSAPAFGGSL